MSRRRTRLGASTGDHDKWAYQADVDARQSAIDSAKAADAGRCGAALKSLLSARGSVAAVSAHVRSGGRDYELTALAATVERAERHFAQRCVRRG